MTDQNFFKNILTLILRYINKLIGKKPQFADKITVADIRPGDVLLFSGDSLISEAIILLTGGGVSHAAMAYDSDDLAHEVPPHAAKANMVKAFGNRTINVMRLTGTEPGSSLNGVLEAAERYVKNAEPYPMSNLYLLGMILIYRRVTPRTLTQSVITKILRVVVSELEEYIRNRKTPGKLPMVCSQFVYQCYKDGNLPLTIKGGVILQAAQTARANLLERVAEQPESIKVAAFDAAFNAPASPSLEDEDTLIAELVDALNKEADVTPQLSGDLERQLDLAPELDAELIEVVNLFSHTVNAAVSSPQPNLLSRGSNAMELTSTSQQGMRWLQDNEALFVTPADLLFNCPALENVGVVEP